jgi:DNA-binding NarL/FixJ family response regulator
LSAIRILVADDYKDWRHQICLLLQVRPELQVICEVSDGSEAVRKAEELKPDLILLDIGLPTLNGLEAARQIRKLTPESKILFLSQESSANVVQEALSVGALGYVVKAHAWSELLAAVEAVLLGRRFVSSVLSGHKFAAATDAQVPDRLRHKEGLPPFAPRKEEITRSHEVQFYSDEASLLVGFTCFIEAALRAGNAAIVIATESHRKSVLQRLPEYGVDVAAAIEQGRYIPLDVAETLSTFMAHDLPDPVRFFRIATDLLVSAGKAALGEHPRVAACGECAPILWTQGRADAAIQLEHLWDEMAKTYDVDILCGYVLKSGQRDRESHIYERICTEHSVVRSH